MSLQDIILNSLSKFQTDSDIHGAIQYITNPDPQSGDWYTRVDIIDAQDNLYIDIEIPGVIDESISIDFCDNKLEISGEKLRRFSTRSIKPTKREITYGKFKRIITLPLSVSNKNNVTTTYINGVLTIIIDKQKEEQKRFSMKVKQ